MRPPPLGNSRRPSGAGLSGSSSDRAHVASSSAALLSLFASAGSSEIARPTRRNAEEPPSRTPMPARPRSRRAKESVPTRRTAAQPADRSVASGRSACSAQRTPSVRNRPVVRTPEPFVRMGFCKRQRRAPVAIEEQLDAIQEGRITASGAAPKHYASRVYSKGRRSNAESIDLVGGQFAPSRCRLARQLRRPSRSTARTSRHSPRPAG